MVFLVFLLGAIVGVLLTLIIILYWQSLVERIILPPEQPHEPPKIIDLEVRDAVNPKVWLGCLLQFLFAELKDTEKIQKWFREKLIIEVEELKEKLPSRIVKDVRLNKFCLGTQPPIISNVKLSSWRTNQSKDAVEEVAVRCDLKYAGEFYVSLDVSLPVGQDAFVFIRLRQLIGNIEIKFSRQPFTHWSVTFTEEPQMILDAVTQVHGRAVPQLATIIVAKIKRLIKRRHVLPNYKIRFPPFFPRPAGQSDPSFFLRNSSANIFDVRPSSRADLSSLNIPSAINVHISAFSRLPPSTDPDAILFFTLTLDSVPLPKQFAHIESLVISVTDPNEALGILFISSLFPVDVIDLKTRRFSILKGYYISAVVADSAAEKAGIKPGGILVSVDGLHVSSTNLTVDSLLRKAATSCKNGTIRLGICNVDSSLCQLVSFIESPPKESPVEVVEKFNIDSPRVHTDSAPSTPQGESSLRFRHRKNLSNASVATIDPGKILNQPLVKLSVEDINSQPLSRSSSDSNLALGADERKYSENSEKSEILRPNTLYSPKVLTATRKDLNSIVAEKPLQQVASLPPRPENCVILQYNDYSSDESQIQQEILAGEVLWTKCRPYPVKSGNSSANLNETLTFNVTSIDEKSQTFLNVVAWIGVLESPKSSSSSSTKKWKRLHAVSYATFDLPTVLEELTETGKNGTFARRTANLHPFASISSNSDGESEKSQIQNQRGFAPELCFGDISLAFSPAGDQIFQPQEIAPFTIYRQISVGQSKNSQSNFQTLSKSASLRVNSKLREMREQCEHNLVAAVSSRSQPCTVCSKSLGILQRLSRSYAPLTCLKCGLLCHPRCVPGRTKSTVIPTPVKFETQELNTLSLSSSTNTLKTSTESLAITPGQSTGNGTMSRWAKRLANVAREKEQKILAKAGPRLAQKWRDLKNRSSKASNGTQSSGIFTLDDENVEVGEDVETLLDLQPEPDNQDEIVVAEELIRAWAAKAAESPGAALEGSLVEALLSNGESDGLLFQLKNLGKELFSELDREPRRAKLEAILSRLTRQLDEESERHAELKTQMRFVRSEETNNGQTNQSGGGLIKKVKQGDYAAASIEVQLNRCDQRIRSLCLLIVHYSSGLDDVVTSELRKTSAEPETPSSCDGNSSDADANFGTS